MGTLNTSVAMSSLNGPFIIYVMFYFLAILLPVNSSLHAINKKINSHRFTVASKFEDGVLMKFSNLFSITNLEHKDLDSVLWLTPCSDDLQRSSNGKFNLIRITGLDSGMVYDFHITLKHSNELIADHPEFQVEAKAVKILSKFFELLF